MLARNVKQVRYLDLLRKDRPYIVVATGAAGTGKTLLAASIGIEKLISKDYKKIVIARPTVGTGEDIGYLPGGVGEKLEPWARPVFDAMSKTVSHNKLDALVKSRDIEMCALAHMRGRSFEHTWMILDEAQNTTEKQMLMVLTRLGYGSKLCITGDCMQSDLEGLNGLQSFIDKMPGIDETMIDMVEFSEDDVERHPAVKTVLKMFTKT